MQRRWGFILAWFAVTAVSVLIATQAVGAIRDSVTDAPGTLPTIAAADRPTPTVPAPSTEAPTTAPPPTTALATTTTVPPTTDPGSPTTTVAPPTTVTTTTTTTTSPPSQFETATYQLSGGWVRIRYGGGEVSLVDAAPYAGFSMDIERRGPRSVEVEFDGDDYEGKFRANMEDGELDVRVEEDGHDD